MLLLVAYNEYIKLSQDQLCYLNRVQSVFTKVCSCFHERSELERRHAFFAVVT